MCVVSPAHSFWCIVVEGQKTSACEDCLAGDRHRRRALLLWRLVGHWGQWHLCPRGAFQASGGDAIQAFLSFFVFVVHFFFSLSARNDLDWENLRIWALSWDQVFGNFWHFLKRWICIFFLDWCSENCTCFSRVRCHIPYRPCLEFPGTRGKKKAVKCRDFLHLGGEGGRGDSSDVVWAVHHRKLRAPPTVPKGSSCGQNALIVNNSVYFYLFIWCFQHHLIFIYLYIL